MFFSAHSAARREASNECATATCSDPTFLLCAGLRVIGCRFEFSYLVIVWCFGLMQFWEVDAERAFGFVDEDALGDARPGRVVGRRFVFEYRPQLPEAYQRGAEAQET